MAEKIETIVMVEKALTVLDLLRTRAEEIGVNEIAKICDFTPSTTHRILKTLEKSGWVFQLSDDRYIAGEKLSFMLEKDNLYLALKDVASIIMQNYSLKYSQAMNLVIRDGKDCYILYQSRTNRLIDYVPPLHAKMPFHASGGGKVLLSELPENMVQQLLENSDLTPLTANTISNIDQLIEEIKKTAARGYAMDYKESTDFACCLSVPVRDRKGTMIAALSFSGIVNIQTHEELLNYLPILQEASREITEQLYRSWEF